MPGPDCPAPISAVLTGRKFCLEENNACKTGGAQIILHITQAGQRDAPRTSFLCVPVCVRSLDRGFLPNCRASGWLKAENGQNIGSPSGLPGDPAKLLAFVLQSFSIFP